MFGTMSENELNSTGLKTEEPIKKRSFLRRLARRLLSFSLIALSFTAVSDLGIKLFGPSQLQTKSGNSLLSYKSPTLKIFGKLINNDALASPM